MYTYNVKLLPYGADSAAGIVEIDTKSNYGYWEHRDGSEGGGLWFGADEGGATELIDYDGAFELPKRVVEALRDIGCIVEE